MRILIIEDDRILSDAVRVCLEKEGYFVDQCFDGENGCYYAAQNAYDLILLDRMLPEMDGIAVLRFLRSGHLSVPVLFVTALSAVGDRVDGLDAGADDYLTKPFAMEELLARVRALVRRPRPMEPGRELRTGDLRFQPVKRELSGPGGKSVLSKTEAVLLELFLKNPGQTLTRDLLYLRVWGPDTDVEPQCVDNYVHFLRRRLKSAGSRCTIDTLRSVGYRLEVRE